MTASRSSWIKTLLFSLVPLVVVLCAGEAALRIFHFRYSDTPLIATSREEAAFNLKSSEVTEEFQGSTFVKDRLLFWTPRPYWEDRYSVEKPPGTTRIVTLGCSCTHGCGGGVTFSYPGFVEEILNKDGSSSYQVLNAGTSGYSSYQGLQQLKHVVTKYSPDMVTVFFGWNDHWFASQPDRLVRIKEDWEIDLINFLEQLRIYQAYHWAIAQLKEKVLRRANKEPLKTFRVSPGEYRENLNAMVDFCRERGISLVFITAPFDKTLLKPSPVFPFSREDLIKTHMTYNGIVRQVAINRQVPLIDLAMALSQIRQTRSPLFPFFSDGIHFNMFGCRVAAELIVESFEKFSLIQDPKKEKASSPL